MTLLRTVVAANIGRRGERTFSVLFVFITVLFIVLGLFSILRPDHRLVYTVGGVYFLGVAANAFTILFVGRDVIRNAEETPIPGQSTKRYPVYMLQLVTVVAFAAPIVYLFQHR